MSNEIETGTSDTTAEVPQMVQATAKVDPSPTTVIDVPPSASTVITNGEDDEGIDVSTAAGDSDAEVETDQEEEYTFNLKFAALVSGGVGSTAMLVHLASNGIEVYPYYAYSGDDNERRAVNLVVSKLRRVYKNIQGLEEVEVKFSKKDVGSEHQVIITAVNEALLGTGVNALAIGMASAYDEDEDDETNSDWDVSELQKHTQLQLVSFETFGMEDPIVWMNKAGEETHRAFFLSRSCENEERRNCGDCDMCKMRHQAFMMAFGKDETKYKKKSYLWKVSKGLIEEGEEEEAADSDEE